jgi:hypothetical protein
VDVWIDSKLREEPGVLESLEHRPVELVREVHLALDAVIEAHPHDEVVDQLDIGDSNQHVYSSGSMGLNRPGFSGGSNS